MHFIIFVLIVLFATGVTGCQTRQKTPEEKRLMDLAAESREKTRADRAEVIRIQAEKDRLKAEEELEAQRRRREQERKDAPQAQTDSGPEDLDSKVSSQASGMYQIVSGAGKCLDVHRPDQAKNGTRLQVWNCGDAPNQLWQKVGLQIRSSAGKCLDVDRPAQRNNGARVQIWDCGRVGVQNQIWQVVGDKIVSGAGKCLDVHRPDQDKNGAVVHVWQCGENAKNQSWILRER